MVTLNDKHLSQLGILLLMALMALTRGHHFGDNFSLPDASLAVFFLMGLLTANRWLLAVLLVEAGLVDYLAINQFGVSDWCISPAYGLLIPTYAVMWATGRFCDRFKALAWQQLVMGFGLVVLATSTAFLISNISFYLLSGYFSDMTLGHYMFKVKQYYPAYASSTLIYVSVLFAASMLVRILLTSYANAIQNGKV